MLVILMVSFQFRNLDFENRFGLILLFGFYQEFRFILDLSDKSLFYKVDQTELISS